MLVETAPGVTAEEILRVTAAPVTIAAGTPKEPR